MLRNASAMIAEREALRKGIEHLTVLFPTVVSSFDFQVENSGRTAQYKLSGQSLRLFRLHSDVNDAHRAGANPLQNNKQPSKVSSTTPSLTTTHSCRYVTHSDHCHTQYSVYAPSFWMQVLSLRERTQRVQSQAYRSRAMWPCCDITSSDDDEHNTDSNFVVQFCPNKSAAGVFCNKPLDPKLHHCYGCRHGGGVDRRHAALARCLADIIRSHSGVKVFIEQEVPALTRVVNGQTEHARMDLVFNLHGSITYLDVSIVAPFSCNPSLVSAASTKPGLMAKRAEKSKFDRYPHINLVPFILETTGRPGPHARKFINYLLRDADNPPIAVRDTCSTIESVLHSAISKQQLTAAVT